MAHTLYTGVAERILYDSDTPIRDFADILITDY